MRTIVDEDLKFITSADLPWNLLEGNNILITGANGFLPAYMAETILFLNDNLFKNKARLYVLGRNKERLLRRFRCYEGRNDLEYIIQDVCAPLKLKDPIDIIIHAASQASPKYYGVDPAGTLSANILGTYNLLELARNNGTKTFLFFSSGEVYGEVNDDQLPINEDQYGYINPVNVRSCYAESKRMAETMCISWMHQYGVRVKIVRPFHTYGPGMRLDDGRVFADFVSDVVADRNIRMKSDGSAIRAFCYLADATAGFFFVLLKGEAGTPYNVGNEEAEISVRDLAYLLAELFPSKKLKVEISTDNQQPGYIRSPFIRHCPDTRRLKNLGWQPHYSLNPGFKRTIESFYE